MATQVVLPKLGMSMSEGTISEWMVKDGDTVKEGQVIYTVENDKSVQDMESPASGVIKILSEEGETYDVGVVVAEIE